MIVTPMTELEAVNEMISAVGESPVNSIENPNNVDVINAIRILNGINRRIQSKGWTFNHVSEYTLNPDAHSKKIRWISTILYIVGTDGTHYVKRGDYLYDFDNQTDLFENPIDVEVIWLVDFEDMPTPMRAYVTAKAARTFQSRYLGDASLSEELVRDEQETWANLMEYELDTNSFNMFNIPGVQTIKTRGN